MTELLNAQTNRGIKPRLRQVPEVLEVDDFTWGNTCTNLACPPVVVMGSGVDSGNGGTRAVEIEPQVHFGSILASAVFASVDAVAAQIHDGEIERVNPDLKTAQEALASFTRGKAQLDVLERFENQQEKGFNEVSRTHFG